MAGGRMNDQNEVIDQTPPRVRLGRRPHKTSRRALQFSHFSKALSLPKATNHWTRRKKLARRSYGNNILGNCTIAKQVVAAQFMERLEQPRRRFEVTTEEINRVYLRMTDDLYGGGDTGAYEDDALNRWRNPELTFRDTKQNPYAISAYLKINAADHDELKLALALAGAKGIACCMNLPRAFEDQDPPAKWDVPDDTPMVGPLTPGGWGGHSMWFIDYTEEGMIPWHTWDDLETNVVTWDAVAAYLDEAHLVIDAMNPWRKKLQAQSTGRLDLGGVRDAVNAISSVLIP
jgi:hypothetical protein